MIRVLAVVAALGLAACGGEEAPVVEQSATTTTSTTTASIDSADEALDAGVQSELRNALTAAKVLATDAAGRFLDADGAPIDAADLAAVEPSLEFADGEGSADAVLVVTDDAGEHIVLVKASASGTAFCIASTADGTVTYGTGATYVELDTIDECSGGSW